MDRLYPDAMDHSDEVPDEPRHVLDLRGLKCPLPVLRARKALLGLAPSVRIDVLCTDPLAGLDIPNLLRETGDTLVATRRDGRTTRFAIRSGGGPGGPLNPGEDPTRRADVDTGNNRKAHNR